MDDLRINPESQIENLEIKISELQKMILLKREWLKKELEKEDEANIDQIEKDIASLKDQILNTQVTLRKTYLKFANTKIEYFNNNEKVNRLI